jgi:glycosyltransferase involved in cell wall biosynthesis
LDLSREINFLGTLSPEQLMEEYFKADVFCLPSRQEGFGIVFLEAMAAGLPIVAARAGATPEVVDKGEVGELFSPGDHLELAKILEGLLRNPQQLLRLGENARKRVQRFDHRRIAYRFARILGAVETSSEIRLKTK